MKMRGKPIGNPLELFIFNFAFCIMHYELCINSRRLQVRLRQPFVVTDYLPRLAYFQ